MINPAPEWVEHVLISEISRLGLQAELLEDGRGNRNPVHIGGDNFKDRSLEDDVGIHPVDSLREGLSLFDQIIDARFLAPHPDGAAGEFDAGVFHHAQIVIQGQVEQGTKSRAARQVVLENGARDGSVEVKVGFFLGLPGQGKRGDAANNRTNDPSR